MGNYRTKATVCADENLIVIGTVNVDSEYETDSETSIVSHVTVTVERTVHGSPSSSFNLDVRGGIVDGVEERVSSHQPIIDGGRYLLILRVDAEGSIHLPYGIGVIGLDPDATLPYNESLATMWGLECL